MTCNLHCSFGVVCSTSISNIQQIRFRVVGHKMNSAAADEKARLSFLLDSARLNIVGFGPRDVASVSWALATLRQRDLAMLRLFALVWVHTLHWAGAPQTFMSKKPANKLQTSKPRSGNKS